MRYRKKPVVIEAYQWTPRSLENQADWPQWLQDAFRIAPEKQGSLFVSNHGQDHSGHSDVKIHTLEGDHVVSDYDWIIQGVAGELYPCKPDIFEQTYEREQ